MPLSALWTPLGAVLVVAVAASAVSAQAPVATPTDDADDASRAEWSYFGGTTAFTRYAPLDQIDRQNVANLRVLWRRPSIDPVFTQAFPELRPSAYLRSTPILVDSVLYASNAVGLVEAFDPGTGETIWMQRPLTPTLAGVAGRAAYGVAYWADGADRRIFSLRNTHRYALDAETGRPLPGFGAGGRVDLTPAGARRANGGSSPIVVGDIVVVAGTVDLGAWCCLSADQELGYVYVPLTAPTAAYYGGHRPGDNLFSNSLVALNARTGERVWHFQMVHHDLWEYDTIGLPTLGDITVDGRLVRAVMQPSKTGFLYVFDRETGEPIWPIEERRVPSSTVPGEQASPTQPFPTKPPPFAHQGVREADIIDFTPELAARAAEVVDTFVLGPIFTPPSIVSDEPGGTQGTLALPGSWGSGNWNTGAFDPESGIYYAFSHVVPRVYRLADASDRPDSEMAYYSPNRDAPYLDGIPLIKPPWGRITAIDLTRGEHAWQVANGGGIRDHDALRGLDLPPLGIASRPVALVTATLLFIGEGGNVFGGIQPNMWGAAFRAYDKATGSVVWETELAAGTTGGPMTYMHEGTQYIVVPIGGEDYPAEWVALGLSR